MIIYTDEELLEGSNQKFLVPRATSPNNVILMRFSLDKHSVEMTHKMFNSVREAFPNNIVVCMPDDVSLAECTLEEFREVVKILNKTLESLEKGLES